MLRLSLARSPGLIVLLTALGGCCWPAADPAASPAGCLGRLAGPRSAPEQVVRVVTTAEGMDAASVEQQVVVPLEQALTGLPGVRRLESVAAEGLGLVELVPEPAADPLTLPGLLDLPVSRAGDASPLLLKDLATAKRSLHGGRCLQGG